MKKIYLVYGYYPHSYHWDICSYCKEEDAKKHVELANKYHKENFKAHAVDPTVCEDGFKNPYDAEEDVEVYSDVQYTYKELILRDRFVDPDGENPVEMLKIYDND